MGVLFDTTTSENNLTFFRKVKKCITYDPAIPLAGTDKNVLPDSVEYEKNLETKQMSLSGRRDK